MTAQLASFFTSVPDGSTISFKSGGRYRVDGTLKIMDRNRLVFEGNGATVFAGTDGDRDRRHWLVVGGSKITFRNMVVKGANPYAGLDDRAYRADREAQHGFDVAGTDGFDLDRVTVTDVYGDFVYLGIHLSRGTFTDNVWIRDSHFERNGRQGVALTGVEDARIERNVITQVRRATFDFEPNGAHWGARRVTISNNRIGTGRLNFLSGHGVGPLEDISILNNTLVGKAMTVNVLPPEGSRRARFRIIGNTSDTGFGSAYPLMSFVRIDGIEVRDNVQRLQADRNMIGVKTRESCQVVVSGNKFDPGKESEITPYTCAAPPSPTNSPTPTPAPASATPAPASATPAPASAAPAPAPPPQSPAAGPSGGSVGTEPQSTPAPQETPASAATPQPAASSVPAALPLPVVDLALSASPTSAAAAPKTLRSRPGRPNRPKLTRPQRLNVTLVSSSRVLPPGARPVAAVCTLLLVGIVGALGYAGWATRPRPARSRR